MHGMLLNWTIKFYFFEWTHFINYRKLICLGLWKSTLNLLPQSAEDAQLTITQGVNLRAIDQKCIKFQHQLYQYEIF